MPCAPSSRFPLASIACLKVRNVAFAWRRLRGLVELNDLAFTPALRQGSCDA
jgi:hypothetical protein